MEGTVGTPPEPLWMAAVTDLPHNKHHSPDQRQGLGVEVGDQHQRGGHHPCTPGKDAAVYTASVVHEKELKWAEKQHADQIAHIA